jgi:hypothetical protein
LPIPDGITTCFLVDTFDADIDPAANWMKAPASAISINLIDQVEFRLETF